MLAVALTIVKQQFSECTHKKIYTLISNSSSLSQCLWEHMYKMMVCNEDIYSRNLIESISNMDILNVMPKLFWSPQNCKNVVNLFILNPWIFQTFFLEITDFSITRFNCNY